jgi:hypothetical protein
MILIILGIRIHYDTNSNIRIFNGISTTALGESAPLRLPTEFGIFLSLKLYIRHRTKQALQVLETVPRHRLQPVRLQLILADIRIRDNI